MLTITLLLCPWCHSTRLVPLTYTEPAVERARGLPEARPSAKSRAGTRCSRETSSCACCRGQTSCGDGVGAPYRLRRGVDVSWTGRRETGVSRASTTTSGGVDFSYRFAAAA